MSRREYSIVEYFAEHEGYKCGYCKGTDTNYSHGMWAHVMSVRDYQDLIDRGWRRSGKYCYKPTMDKTCCPQYTIKCDANEFKPTKSHKKVLKKFFSYVIKGRKENMDESTGAASDETGSSAAASSSSGGTSVSDQAEKNIETESRLQRKKTNTSVINKEITAAEANKSASSPILVDEIQPPNCDNNQSSLNTTTTKTSLPDTLMPSPSPSSSEGTTTTTTSTTITKTVPRPGIGPDPNRPRPMKAKQLRLERKRKKLEERGMEFTPDTNSNKTSSNEAKSLEDFVNASIPEDSQHKFEMRLVWANTNDQEFAKSFHESFQIYKKYQVAIHKDPPAKVTMNQFKRFLCDSSLLRERHPNGGPSHGLGAFHQQYLIDGKIICVGVLDILPNCVSSVYLYYDPDFSFLSLGTLSSLFEMTFVRKLSRAWPELKYYYMGYYIHSCPKMRYKGQYLPSYLLCPETYDWFEIADCTPKLDKSNYARFNPDPTKTDSNGHLDMGKILILYEEQVMPYEFYREITGAVTDGSEDECPAGGASSAGSHRPETEIGSSGADEEEVLQYAGFVGNHLAQRMLLFRAKPELDNSY